MLLLFWGEGGGGRVQCWGFPHVITTIFFIRTFSQAQKKKRFWSVCVTSTFSPFALAFPSSSRTHPSIHLPRGAESLVSLAFFTFILYMNFFELPNIPPYHETLQLDDLRSLPPHLPPFSPNGRAHFSMHCISMYRTAVWFGFQSLDPSLTPPGPSGRHACMCYCRPYRIPTAFPASSNLSCLYQIKKRYLTFCPICPIPVHGPFLSHHI